jgi:hypothetical protein
LRLTHRSASGTCFRLIFQGTSEKPFEKKQICTSSASPASPGVRKKMGEKILKISPFYALWVKKGEFTVIKFNIKK